MIIMDLSLNRIHRLLIDASLPSTIEDLKNPTEEYAVNLLTAFLSRFHINVNLIDQPLADQLDAMTHYEDSDIINLINLHAVVTQILDKIFVHDFSLTDITSPGQKRFRKQLKLLSNFTLYTMHKMLAYNDRKDEIQSLSQRLEELKERKAQSLEATNNMIMFKAKQLSMIEKLENEIQIKTLKIEENAKKIMELEAVKSDVAKETQKAKELNASVKAKAGMLSKMITEIQSEIVNSPEEYRSRLDEIQQQRKLKEEERRRVQEVIQCKKQSIKEIEKKLNLQQKITGDFCTLADIYKKQKGKKTELNNISKDIDLLNDKLSNSQNMLAMHKDQVDVEKKELQTYLEEEIVPLKNVYDQLLNEKKIQKAKLDKAKDLFNEKRLKRDKLLADIKKIEEEITVIGNYYQEAYNKEVADERELREAWNKKIIKK